MSIRRIAVEEAFVTEEVAQEWKKVLACQNRVEPESTDDGPHPFSARTRVRAWCTQDWWTRALVALRQIDADGIDINLPCCPFTSPGYQVFDAVTATRFGKRLPTILWHRQYVPIQSAWPAWPQLPRSTPLARPRNSERAMTTLAMKGFLINSPRIGRAVWMTRKIWPIFEARRAIAGCHRSICILGEPSPAMASPFLEYGLYFCSLWVRGGNQPACDAAHHVWLVR